MGSICGIIYKYEQAGEEEIRKMLHALSGWDPDYTGFIARDNVAFGSQVLYSMEYSSFETLPWEDERYIYLYDGRFDLPHSYPKNEDGRSITAEKKVPSAKQTESFETSDPLLHAESYKRLIINHLRESIEQKNPVLRGDFAIAIWDKIEKKLIGLRDHLGVRPFFYTQTNEYFAFATGIKALLALPAVQAEPDEQWIADSISTIRSEKFRTPYRNIFRLLPAHILTFDGYGVSLKKYWDLEANPVWENISEQEAIQVLYRKLTLAVERRVKYAISAGSELSGGLDSSGVTALAQKILKDKGKEVLAFSHGFSESKLGEFFPFEDEQEFSKALAAHAGISDHIICTAENYGIVNALEQSIGIHSGPIQQNYSLFADCLYDEAQKRGVRILLSGFGGDEGVTSKAGGYIPELVRLRKWKKLKDELVKAAGKKKLALLKAHIKYAGYRYFSGFFSSLMQAKKRNDRRIQKWNKFAIQPEFERKMSIKKRYVEMVGIPEDPDVRKRQYKRILHNHVSQRFEYSYLAALHRGMEYAYPLWDIDLIEFFYSLPSHLKVKSGMSRYLYREALKNILPEKIRTRIDKSGTTIPTVFQRFHNDYAAISEIIKKAEIENRTPYLKYKTLKKWKENIKDRGNGITKHVNPGVFFNCLQLMLWKSGQEARK